MLNRLIAFFLTLSACASVFTLSAANEPQLISESGILINADTGQVLFEKDADSKRPPASITKLMTALLVLENTKMDDVVTANHEAVYNVDRGSTHIWLQDGEQLTVEQAMYAMILESANDAANVLAVHIAGTLDAFSSKMNARAKQLGCLNTNFINANGLDTEGHYSSARDIALIAKALMKHPKFLEIAGARQFQIPATNKNDGRIFNTKHDMLRKNSSQYDADVVAGKTGWTTNARHTLVTFGQRNGVNLIAVVFASTKKNEKFSDTRNLLNYGFENFSVQSLNRSDLFNAAVSNYQDEAAGIYIDGSSLTDTPVMLRSGETKDMLKYSFAPLSKPAVTVSLAKPGSDAIKLFELPVSIIDTTPEHALEAAPKTEHAPSVLMTFVAPAVVFLVIGLLGCIIYMARQRALRIRRRKQRERLREIRRRQFSERYDWDTDL